MAVKEKGQSTQLTPPISEHILRAPSLAKLIDGFLFTLRSEGKSPKTVAYYSVQLRGFLWWCEGGNAPTDVDHITTSHLRQFLVYVRTTDVRWGGTTTRSRKAVNQTSLRHYYTSLHRLFQWLVSEGIVSQNPLTGIEKPRLQHKVVPALSQEEIKRLLALCDNKTLAGVRNRAILMLFLDTGVRLSELAALKPADVDFQRATILVRKGKGGKQRVVHMGSKSQQALWRWLLYTGEGSDSLFGLKDRGISQMIKTLCERAQITGGHGVHRLRHSFATEFLRAGGDVMSLQYLLGHSSLEMVKVYVSSMGAEDAIRAHKRFSPMDSLEFRGKA